MFAAVSIPWIFGSLIWGDILSKYGRRIVLVLSLTALGLSTIMFSWINFISSSSTIVYVICGIRAIEGFSSGFIYCAVRSIIFITYREEKVKYLAYVEAFESATMIFAPAVGSIMYELLGFEMVFVILGAFDLMVASAIMFVVSKDVDKLILLK